MQEKQILKHTKQAVEQLTPDCFDAIWERASNANPEEYPLPDDILTSKKAGGTVRRWIAGLSVLAACMLCFFGFRWYENHTVYTTINLDVNPSIRICINRQEKIVSMTGLNTDGKKVVNALASPAHRSLDEVLEETVVELVEAGYFTMDDANAILISVDSKNSSNAEELMESLSNQVSTTMGKKEIYGEVISQQIPRDDKEVEQLARELHISNGKATLIRNMASKNKNFSEKDLADMKINEIVETAEKECMDMSSFKQPARMRDVPPPKEPKKSDAADGKKDNSDCIKTTVDTEHSNNTNAKERSTQSNRATNENSTAGSAKQPKATEAPKTTEQPKVTEASKKDSDKKKNDNEKQQDTQRDPVGQQQRETGSDRRDTSETSSPSVTVAPDPTSTPEDGEHRREDPRHPQYPRYPEHPRNPREATGDERELFTIMNSCD